jgi:hypothetical protein
MKKIIFKFWISNFLISIALFVIYRIVIAETKHAGGNFFEIVLQILDILLNIAYSFIYLIAIVFCSFIRFLNLIENIRTKSYLSLLTFIGIPSFCVIFIIVKIFIHNDLHTATFIINLLFFSVVYLFITAIEFLLFRKKIKKLKLKK